MKENGKWVHSKILKPAGGHYLSLNPAMARLHGYASPEEMLAAVTDIPRHQKSSLRYREIREAE